MGPLNATAEGEHRFFAALLLCYGLAFLWCVPDVAAKRRPITLLAAAFLLGGLARPRACRNLPDSPRISIRYRLHSTHTSQPKS
jgi:hypothetical protein